VRDTADKVGDDLAALTDLPLSCFIWICDWAVVTVVPFEKAPGWLTEGVVFTTTERLPWATAQFSSVTVWFITIEPVRAFRITFAAASAGRTWTFSSFAMKATCCVGSATHPAPWARRAPRRP
jgi:hypothetical protein